MIEVFRDAAPVQGMQTAQFLAELTVPQRLKPQGKVGAIGMAEAMSLPLWEDPPLDIFAL